MFIFTLSDINECGVGIDNCHPNATCTDTVGSFECSCNSGLTGNGVNCLGEFITVHDAFSQYAFFIDIDECEMGTDNCDNQTTFCNNSFGEFDCLCLSGYIDPNGTSCQRKLKSHLEIVFHFFHCTYCRAR